VRFFPEDRVVTGRSLVKRFVLAVFACASPCTLVGQAAPDRSAPSGVVSLTPVAEHHAHLISPTIAPMAEEPPLPAIDIPAEAAALLHALERGWSDEKALAPLLTSEAVYMNLANADLPTWVVGRTEVARAWAGRFARAYRITAVAYQAGPSHARVAGYFTRGDGAAARHFGHVLLSLERDAAGAWQVAAIVPAFPGPPVREPITARQVVAQLDDAGIRRAAVLSVAYWYGNPDAKPDTLEYQKVRAENDWVAREIAPFADRLVGFCSFNPLKDYALAEVARCGRNPSFKGIKLHFGNSWVDLRNPQHLAKVRAVFRAANENHLAIIAHLFTDATYEKEGRTYAAVVLNELLPAAPDVPVQIAHMAGGGRATDSALEVFADAIARGDPRAKHLYFDVATLTAGETPEGLRRDAMRMRQIGFGRILFGTDASPPNPSPRESWELFRVRMPLTDGELRAIASNAAPYFR
jgi:uncharacterized protein